MKEDKLSIQSMDFAVSVIELVKFLKEKRAPWCSIFCFLNEAHLRCIKALR